MAPRNSGSRRLKARRTRIRQRYFDQIVEILPTLASNSTRTLEEVVLRRFTESDDFLDWSSLHAELDPGVTMHGRLPESRANRKKMQIKSILSWADGLLPQGGVAVDFCGGSGHLGLVLATLRSDATIYIVEKKGAHCDIAQKRSDLMGLKNVKVKNLEVSEFHEAFDVGLGLHACGPATDLIHSKCLAAGASYVLAPCCYGFISKALDKYKLEYVDKNTNADMVMLTPDDLPPQDLDSDFLVNAASLAGTPALGGYFFVRGRDTDPQRMLKANGSVVDPSQDMDEVEERENQEERVAAAKAREDAVVRARVYLQAKEQEEREMKAPMQTSVRLLDEILGDIRAIADKNDCAMLDFDKQRLLEIKRSTWGCGVSFPRSQTFRKLVDVSLYSAIAGSADGTFWPTEYSFTEQRENFARSCMFAVDLDRSLAAEETGYLATMTSMCDGDIDAAGQKNQLLIGRPGNRIAQISIAAIQL